MRRIPGISVPTLALAAVLLLPAARAAAICLSIRCGPNIITSTAVDQCGAVIDYSAPTPITVLGGNCGTIVCVPGSGSFFPRGETTVSCVSSDGAACDFSVTLYDPQPPIPVAGDQTVSGTTPGEPLVVSYPPPIPTDNCPGSTVACDPPSGSAFASGGTTVTCTATDSSGNTGTSSFETLYFDACVKDDVSGALLRWSTAEGDYEFEDCGVSACEGGTALSGSGTGLATPTPAGFLLTDVKDDRSVRATVRLASGKGNARVKLRQGSTRTVSKLKDASLADDVCSCP